MTKVVWGWIWAKIEWMNHKFSKLGVLAGLGLVILFTFDTVLANCIPKYSGPFAKEVIFKVSSLLIWSYALLFIVAHKILKRFVRKKEKQRQKKNLFSMALILLGGSSLFFSITQAQLFIAPDDECLGVTSFDPFVLFKLLFLFFCIVWWISLFFEALKNPSCKKTYSKAGLFGALFLWALYFYMFPLQFLSDFFFRYLMY
jgi:hypothetical protein